LTQSQAGGGLIIGSTHHVQLDTPLENFRAMDEAILTTPCRRQDR